MDTDLFSGINKKSEFPELLKRLSARYVCEVGVLRGDNLKLLSSDPDVLCFGVDKWKDDLVLGTNDLDYPLEEFYVKARSLQVERSNVVLLRVDSKVAASYFPDQFFDLVYIDANHTYEAVRGDIDCWWDKVRQGGVLSGHDYRDIELNGVCFGVIQAVDELVRDRSVTLHVTEDPFPSWMVIKV